MTRNRWWIVVAVAVAIAAVVVVALAMGGTPTEPDASPTASTPATEETTSTAEETTSPSPEPSPVPTPAPTETQVDESTDARDLVAPFVSADAAARQDPAQPLDLAEVATGSALADLAIQVEELTAGGLTQVGSPTVVSATVQATEPDADPPTATVLVCLDYSEVDLVNASGESVKDPAAPTRAAAIFGLVREGDAWLVAERSFPDDPTC